MTRWPPERRDLLFEGLTYVAFGIAFSVLTLMVRETAAFRLMAWMVIGIGFIIVGRSAMGAGIDDEPHAGGRNPRAFLLFYLAGALPLWAIGSRLSSETRSMLWLALPLASSIAVFLFWPYLKWRQ